MRYITIEKEIDKIVEQRIRNAGVKGNIFSDFYGINIGVSSGTSIEDDWRRYKLQS